jgi:hypothetical protein
VAIEMEAEYSTGYLEAAHVVVFPACGPDGLERAPLRLPRVVDDAEVHERPHQVRPEEAELPRHDGAPVVPDHEHLPQAEHPVNVESLPRGFGVRGIERVAAAAAKPGAGRGRR